MSNIAIGINENVILDKVELVEKDGKLSVDFSLRKKGAASAANPDPMAFLDEQYDENGMLITGGKTGLTIKVWPINVPKKEDKDGNPKTVKAQIDEANDASKEMQNMFALFARCYVTSDKIKFDRFRGLQLTADSLTRLLDENVLVQVTRNLAQQFLEICGEYLGKDEYPLRLLLRRQSKAKPYPAFRDRYLQSFPFVESMAIPQAASKIEFTKYEISAGLNTSTVETATDDNTALSAPQDAGTVFGMGAAAGTGDLPTAN